MAHPVAQREYFSREHVAAAAMHARGARRLELEHAARQLYLSEHRAHAIGAVIFSAAALEAAANELFSDASDNPASIRPVDEVAAKRLGALWRADVPRTAAYPILEKYAIALLLTDRAGFDTGTEPWQSASALVKLRNALIHYEPEWVPMPGGDQTHSFEKSLRGKFPENPLAPADSPYYPAKLLGHGCAQWAVRTALVFSTEFSKRMGLFGPWLGKADSPELATE
jgi:hypothetical protein